MENNFKTVANMFLENRNGEVQDLTLSAYTRKISKNIEPYLGLVSMEEVASPNCLNLLANELENKGYSENYISQVVSLVRRIVRFYRDMQTYEGVARTTKSKTVKYLEKEEISNIYKIAKAERAESNRVIAIALAMFAGMTVSEICALKWEDVDLTYRIIVVSKCVKRVPSKDRNTKTKLDIQTTDMRIVPINDSLLEFISKYTNDIKCEYVISGSTGIVEPRLLEYYISNLFDGRITLGDLRDWFCIEAIKKGVPIHIIANYTGVTVQHLLLRYEEFLTFSESQMRTEINKICM